MRCTRHTSPLSILVLVCRLVRTMLASDGTSVVFPWCADPLADRSECQRAGTVFWHNDERFPVPTTHREVNGIVWLARGLPSREHSRMTMAI